jgi:hypothetical protein
MPLSTNCSILRNWLRSMCQPTALVPFPSSFLQLLQFPLTMSCISARISSMARWRCSCNEASGAGGYHMFLYSRLWLASTTMFEDTLLHHRISFLWMQLSAQHQFMNRVVAWFLHSTQLMSLIPHSSSVKPKLRLLDQGTHDLTTAFKLSTSITPSPFYT